LGRITLGVTLGIRLAPCRAQQLLPYSSVHEEHATMKHKRHSGPGPIPAGNQSQTGPTPPAPEQSVESSSGGASMQEQDPKRRLGDYTTEGEHSFVQPGGRNDSDGRPSSGAGK